MRVSWHDSNLPRFGVSGHAGAVQLMRSATDSLDAVVPAEPVPGQARVIREGGVEERVRS